MATQTSQSDRSDGPQAPVEPTGARTITAALLRHVGTLAEACGATAIFVYVDALHDEPLPLPESLKPKVYYVTKTPDQEQHETERGGRCLRVPNVALSRMGQVKIAIFLALSRGLIRRGDRVVFLSGLSGSGELDTVVVIEVGREYEMLCPDTTDAADCPDVQPQVLSRVIDIASELGSEGREGKPVGALFIVGDTEHVLPLTRQLILNPFAGYPAEKRNVLDESLTETIKELATIDGAFIIRADGTVESCGTYLKTASQKEFELPQGLGARHHAAAAITSVTRCLAVTVSESTGTVTVFRNGAIVTDIERPRSLGRRVSPGSPKSE